MGQPVKFKAGDRIGKHKILMLTDSWIPEGKDYRYRSSIFECPLCSKSFIGVLNYINSPKISDKVSCGCNLIYRAGDLVGDNKVLLLETYPTIQPEGGKRKERRFKFQCNHCDGTFMSNISQVALRGRTSCGCIGIVSVGENELRNYIEEIAEDTKIRKNARVLNLKEIDIYLEDLKIGFEYNGLYWHSQERGKTVNYHKDKTELAKSLNIKLFHIFEHQWKFKKDILKDLIYKSIYPERGIILDNNFKIVLIPEDEAKLFVSANTLDSYKSTSLNIGLQVNNELVNLISFTENKDALNFKLENITSKVGVNYLNGLKVILEYFECNYSWKSIVVHIDNAFPNHSILKDTNFLYHSTLEPDAYLFKTSNLKVITKVDDEIEIPYAQIEETKYLKYWDCGNDMYIKLKGKT